MIDLPFVQGEPFLLTQKPPLFRIISLKMLFSARVAHQSPQQAREVN
jgi:hypothetical protein